MRTCDAALGCAMLLAVSLAGCQGGPPAVPPGQLTLEGPSDTATVFVSQSVRLPFTVRNAASAPVDVRFEAVASPELTSGVMEPQTLTVGANATAPAAVVFGPARALAGGAARQSVEVSVRALVGSNIAATRTWNVQVRSTTLGLSSPLPGLHAAAGTQVTFPVVAGNGGSETLQVQLRAGEGSPPAAAAPDKAEVASRGAGGGFVTFDLRDTVMAPGDHTLRIEGLVDGGVAASTSVTLTLVRPQDPARQGDQVTVDYVGRFPNGTLFDTSLREVALAALPGASKLPLRDTYQPLATRLGPGGGTITGFWQGLVGMDVNQSRTVVLEPWEAYGNTSTTIDFPRRQDVPRVSEPLERDLTFPRANLESAGYINASSKAGDLVRLPNPAGGASRLFRISEIDSNNAFLTWEVAVGGIETLYPVWPNQSVAVQVNATHVMFRTDPQFPGGNLTWFQFWPNMTRLGALNETAMTIEHTPRVGMTFSLPGGARPRTATILSVSDAVIVLRVPNEHALAGQRLVFDLTLRSVQHAPG